MNLVEYVKTNYYRHFEKKHLPFEIKRRFVPKGEVIYPKGRQSDRLYFLAEGVVETLVSFGEVEKTLSFIFSGNFFEPFASNISGEPSDMEGVALTDCIVEEFRYSDYEKACAKSVLPNKIGRVELSKYYMQKYKRESDFLTKTTLEVYLDLVEDHPEIFQHIPLKKIARYLGVLPETLSRIRRKMVS